MLRGAKGGEGEEGRVGGRGGGGGRAELRADSRFAIVRLLLGGFGVMPSCAKRRALEGGAPV